MDIPEWMTAHEKEDARRFNEQTALIATLATKDDIKEVMEFMKNVRVGIGVVEFSFDNAGKIGSFLILIFGVYLAIRYGLAGLLAWFTTNKFL